MQANTNTMVVGHEFLNLIQNDADILKIVKNQIPIFVCERNSAGGLSFKCPYCNRKHHHKAGNGFRNAHCFRKPPLYTAGYYLVEKDATTNAVVSAEKIKRANVKSFLEHLNGKMFGVDFIKQDNSFRSMTCKLGVTAPLKGGKNKVEALDRPYLTVYDIAEKGYRTVNLDTLRRIRTEGTVYDVID